jgi:hypothetical protein
VRSKPFSLHYKICIIKKVIIKKSITYNAMLLKLIIGNIQGMWLEYIVESLFLKVILGLPKVIFKKTFPVIIFTPHRIIKTLGKTILPKVASILGKVFCSLPKVISLATFPASILPKVIIAPTFPESILPKVILILSFPVRILCTVKMISGNVIMKKTFHKIILPFSIIQKTILQLVSTFKKCIITYVQMQEPP